MGRIVSVLAVLFVVVLGARQLLPERYAVNAPIRQLLFGQGGDAPAPELLGTRIRVPEGFSIGIWAAGLPNARFLRFTPAGDLLVSRPRAGRVDLLHADADGDGRSDGRTPLLAGLDRPHGLDVHDGWLYVGENGAVRRVRLDAAARAVAGPLEMVVPDLLEGGNHWTRTVRVGPDGGLYVSVGSSCNVCVEEDPRRAALLRYRLDGSGGEVFASGLRNAVGFDWQPGTGALYATDNGRDLLGDDFPPCELNRVERGSFYGWPFANGDRVPDPDLGKGRTKEIAGSVPPAHGFRAHTAPLGITFVRGDALPAPWRGAAIVALHGSWNRTRKDGYEVVSLHWTPRGIEERPFVSGLLADDDVIGRPVDVAEGPDGALYVSDDYAGVVYRVAWVGRGAEAPRGLRPPPGPPDEAGPAPDPLAALAPDEAGPEPDPLAALAPDERERRAGRGRRLFAEHDCARCHEAEAAPPGTVVVPLAGLGARHDVEGLRAFLAAPTPPMPVAPLSDEERRDLAVHLLESHP